MKLLKSNIKTQIFAVIFLLSVVPLIFVFSFLFSYMKNDSYSKALQYSNSNIIKLGHNLDNIFQGINDLSLYLIASGRIRTFLSANPDQINKNNYSLIINDAREDLFIAPFSKHIASISVISMDGRIISTKANPEKLSDEERKEAQVLNGKYFWSVDQDEKALKTKSLSFIRLVRNPPLIKESLGYIRIELRLGVLDQIFNEPQSDIEYEYLILSANSPNVLFTKNNRNLNYLFQENLIDQQIVKQNAKSASEVGLTYEIELEDKNIITSAYPFFGDDLIIYSFLSDSFLQPYSTIIVNIIIFMTILYIAIASGLILFFKNKILKPLHILSSHMNIISKGDFDTRIELNVNNEISFIAHQFNNMASRLQFLYEEIYKSKIKLKEAELAVLVSKVNPHFLYNTLDTIYWMADMNLTDETKNMTSALSELFRLSLAEDENGFITLDQEIKSIRCYLVIQSYRYGEKVHVTMNVEDHIENLGVVKLVLQPLVENAYIHGMEPHNGGKVEIDIYTDQGVLIYSIYNSGNSPDKNEIEQFIKNKNNSEKGFALNNIDERIKLIFGDQFGLEYEQSEKDGALFIVKQPMIDARGRLT